ncbi:BON domain-containing protein [Paraburkholderia sp. 22B1P]|uniref:BON domain-containing protein n=1 Tax=Paraburkholderia sp. 22B1P TaxID=3080498 RepID=UPI00208937F3|nr:BON domain-containing protein [Paraburkholderia sp. 22B1P]GJH38695.1 BON domain-containing protein [Paraburkholderia hospita]
MRTMRIVAVCLLSLALNGTNAFAQSSSVQPASAVSTKAANRSLAKSVRRALGRVKGLDPTRIYVKASDGTVTLSGNLRTQAQIDLAGRTASAVQGVVSVNNRIVIFSEGDVQ